MASLPKNHYALYIEFFDLAIRTFYECINFESSKKYKWAERSFSIHCSKSPVEKLGHSVSGGVKMYDK